MILFDLVWYWVLGDQQLVRLGKRYTFPYRFDKYRINIIDYASDRDFDHPMKEGQ